MLNILKRFGWMNRNLSNRTRIRLVDEVDTPELSLAHLREHGLKGNIQGSMKLTGILRDYIMSFFERDLTEGYYPDEVPETLEEGKRKNVMVNVYERTLPNSHLCSRQRNPILKEVTITMESTDKENEIYEWKDSQLLG